MGLRAKAVSSWQTQPATRPSFCHASSCAGQTSSRQRTILSVRIFVSTANSSLPTSQSLSASQYVLFSKKTSRLCPFWFPFKTTKRGFPERRHSQSVKSTETDQGPRCCSVVRNRTFQLRFRYLSPLLPFTTSKRRNCTNATHG